MRVILIDDVPHTGRRGQEVEVKPGFARNYLFPQGFAVQASHANRQWFEQQKKKIEERIAHQRDAAVELAGEIANARVEIRKRVGETETLYGSVTASEVADALAEKGIQVDKRRVDVGGGIKSIGDHRVSIQLHADVEAELLVTVLPLE